MLTQPEDFISLELLGGYPRLTINHGTGTNTLTLDGRDKAGAVIMRKLSDGVWHRIDIVRTGKVGLGEILIIRRSACELFGTQNSWYLECVSSMPTWKYD